ncbi:very short patch repair endonuclease [Aeromicrobium flavum]|uniref:Very short patch repair endonuclease n=1 Tax=Aeromicrobium flavum TaxID=416568 RepID=A0A512HU73_9ACTN|nr:very short patch repair endonuclease [Aeromicrobium flavum]GEO89001.1 very short patch repair endonuclease [Aeromicrobium flavum]
MPAYESWASSPASRKVMRANKSRDTAPELAVRRLLHAEGFRYRVNHRPDTGLRRTADIVFSKQRIAVFIDGCYWHACAEHGTTARANAGYWSSKLASNVARDRDTNEQLRARGWTVLRFWEHEDPVTVARAIADSVRQSEP